MIVMDDGNIGRRGIVDGTWVGEAVTNGNSDKCQLYLYYKNAIIDATLGVGETPYFLI
jgi:hypothetical protein